MNDQTLSIENIYAPNNVRERKTFFSKINKWIDKYALYEGKIIRGGDFNFTVENIDRRANTDIRDASSNSYKNLMSVNALHDIWRKMH